MILNQRHLLIVLLCSICQSFIAKADVGFIENKGQWHQNVKFSADVPMGRVYLENQGITYLFWDKEKIKNIHDHKSDEDFLDYHAVKLKFLGSNPAPAAIVENQSETYYNYYLGNDPNKWATGLHAYQQVTFIDVYPNIDLKIEGFALNFKYSFIVKPGGDPSKIQLQYQGANDILINSGSLMVTTSLGDIVEEQPYSFQVAGSLEKEVPSNFKLEGNLVSFKIGEFDNQSDLIIDPSVIFSSLSGSTVDNWGFTATYDSDGHAYSGGTVYGTGYPLSTGAFQRKFANNIEGNPNRDCGIFKLNENGTVLLFATYYGGAGNEQPHSLVVNPAGDLLVMGTTESRNLPMAKNPAQSGNRGGWDLFVANFSSNGKKLNGSTYLGGTGSDGVNGEYADERNSVYDNPNNLVWNYGDLYRGEIIAGPKNEVFVVSTTESSSFPASNNAFDRLYNGQQDAVVLKLSQNLDTIVWSTFLGGSRDDAAYSLDLDEELNVYVTGGTKGAGFPTSNGAYNRSFNGGQSDAFLAKISANGEKLLYSTFIGTSRYDQSFFIKIGPDGNPWIYGQTESNFPTKKTSGNQNSGMFITKFNKDLSDILISRVFGANGRVNISPSAFTVDLCGRVYLSGWGALGTGRGLGNTTGLTTTGDAFDRFTDGKDFYMAVYTADLSTIIYATFFGGTDESGEHVDGGTSRFDKRGVIYQAICAACGEGFPSFPTYPSNVHGPATKHSSLLNCNNAVVKLDLEGPAIYAEFENDSVICQVPQTIQFTNYTQKATEFLWKMGDGKTYTDSNVRHTFTKPGTYTVQLIAYNPIACNLRDTITKTIEVYAEAEADFSYEIDVCTKSVEFRHTGAYGRNFLWDLGDGTSQNSQNISHQYNTKGKYRIKLTADKNTGCEDTFSVQIELEDPFTDFEFALDSCNKFIKTTNASTGYKNLEWQFGDGTITNAENPDHSYAKRGTYNLVLRTNIGTECEDSLVEEIEILEPLADFEFEIDTCTQTAIFTNNSQDADGYNWDFGFTTSKEKSPEQKYPEGDKTYSVQLIAAPYSACADTSEINFRMPNLPSAEFTSKADTCLSAAQFTSYLTDAPNWIWYFGNGDSTREKDPYYNFRDTGSFNIMLIAYPYSDCPDTAAKSIDVDTFRFALFDVSLDTCSFEIQLKNQSKDLDSFYWSFKDTINYPMNFPNHKFRKDGDYSLNVYGLKTFNGCEDSFEYDLYIPPLPVPGNKYLNDTCFNTYIFTDTSTYGVNSYWFSSKGDSAVGKEFIVNFPKVGNYRIWQVSESQYGCLDTLEIPIRIDSIPTASFGVTLDSCIGAVITQDQSIGRFRTQWYFGNNTGSNESEPIVNYENEGSYTITMVINKGTECEDSIQKEVKITEYQSKRIFIPNVFTPNNDGSNDEFIIDNLRPDCDNYKIFIYNRWGELVHQDEGQLDPWNGTTSDAILGKTQQPLETGTYYYILQSDAVSLSGSITILR